MYAVLHCHSGENEWQCGGSKVCTGCPYSFCTGEIPSLQTGVLRYCSKTLQSLSSSRVQLVHNALKHANNAAVVLVAGYDGLDTH